MFGIPCCSALAFTLEETHISELTSSEEDKLNLTLFWETLPDPERAKAESDWQRCREMLTSAGGAQRQFAINLEVEYILCEACWQTIHHIVSSNIMEVRVLQIELTRACRNHTLQSQSIAPPIPTSFGRAVTKELFADVLRDQFGFSSVTEEEQFMFDLLRRAATLDSNRAQLRGKLMAKAKRVMWATFEADKDGILTNSNPFDSMPDNADGIRARLGLSMNDKGKDLLLFVYNLPGGTEAHYPTIAEAYAGDTWTWYFRPALESERWGRTMTWDSCPDPPLPEIVHETIACSNLVEKIREIKGS